MPGVAAKNRLLVRIMIAGTLAACATALLLRTQLRSLYWAERLTRASSLAEQAAYLTLLCQAGAKGHWGTARLLNRPEPQMRQFGVLTLRKDSSAWARERLLRALHDPDAGVRELAALGLAIQGDPTAVPFLKELYLTGDEPSAAAACLALERLATPDTIVALNELATAADADPNRRAALVDALAGAGQPGCIPALIRMLDDDRAVTGATLNEQAQARALAIAAGRAAAPASSPSLERPQRSVAQRAAEALGRITGLKLEWSAGMSAAEREAAKQQWLAMRPAP